MSESSRLPTLTEAFTGKEEQEAFVMPSCKNTRLSDSAAPPTDSFWISKEMLSAGATNVFDESVNVVSCDEKEQVRTNIWNDDLFSEISGSYNEESNLTTNTVGGVFAEATNYSLSIYDSFESKYEFEQDLASSEGFGFSLDHGSSSINCRSKSQQSSAKSEIAPEIYNTEYSAGVTNLDFKPIMDCKLTTENFEEELSKFLQNVHATERFKLTYERVSRTVSLVDITEPELWNLVKQHGCVSIMKVAFDKERGKKFASMEKRNKRSLASCQSVSRGLALAEKFNEIQSMNLDNKSKNNRFTNFQRKDRNTGAKLEMQFLAANCLTKYSSYSDIERQCETTLAIFDTEGYLKYLSPKFGKKAVYFFEEKDEIFFVKNLKGFCRIE